MATLANAGFLTPMVLTSSARWLSVNMIEWTHGCKYFSGSDGQRTRR